MKRHETYSHCVKHNPCTPTRSKKSDTSPPPSTTQMMIPVIDPLVRTGKLLIPLEKLEDTRGLQEWMVQTHGTSSRGQQHYRKDFSVCCLYQSGRCRLGDSCNQIHIDREYMQTLRSENGNKVTCCLKCSSSPCPVGSLESIVVQLGDHTCVPLERFGITQAFDPTQWAAHERWVPTISYPMQRVCRLHLQGLCKYGKDCRNIHVCGDFMRNIKNAPSTPSPPPVMSVHDPLGGSGSPSPAPPTVVGGVLPEDDGAEEEKKTAATATPSILLNFCALWDRQNMSPVVPVEPVDLFVVQ